MKRLPFLVPILLLLFVSTFAEAAPRRRTVRAPAVPDLSPEAWLRLHAFPIQTTNLVPSTIDLEPLRAIVGDADIVAFGPWHEHAEEDMAMLKESGY